jgi:hypothetical protein
MSTAIQGVLEATGWRHRRDEHAISQWRAVRHVGVQEVSKVVEGVQDWRKNVVDSAKYDGIHHRSEGRRACRRNEGSCRETGPGGQLCLFDTQRHDIGRGIGKLAQT